MIEYDLTGPTPVVVRNTDRQPLNRAFGRTGSSIYGQLYGDQPRVTPAQLAQPSPAPDLSAIEQRQATPEELEARDETARRRGIRDLGQHFPDLADVAERSLAQGLSTLAARQRMLEAHDERLADRLVRSFGGRPAPVKSASAAGEQVDDDELLARFIAAVGGASQASTPRRRPPAAVGVSAPAFAGKRELSEAEVASVLRRSR